jgi:hypothetical protein
MDKRLTTISKLFTAVERDHWRLEIEWDGEAWTVDLGPAFTTYRGYNNNLLEAIREALKQSGVENP